MPGMKNNRRSTVRLNERSPWEQKLCTDDVVVLGGGRWYDHPANSYQPPMKKGSVTQRNLEAAATAVKGVRARLERAGFAGVVVWRTYSPAHFGGGEWNTGGSCGGKAYDGGARVSWSQLAKREAQLSEHLAQLWSGTSLRHFAMLNVTGASRMRYDGHPGPSATNGAKTKMDCVHWCLPGIPDAWNAMLLALLKAKRLDGNRSEPLSDCPFRGHGDLSPWTDPSGARPPRWKIANAIKTRAKGKAAQAALRMKAKLKTATARAKAKRTAKSRKKHRGRRRK